MKFNARTNSFGISSTRPLQEALQKIQNVDTELRIEHGAFIYAYLGILYSETYVNREFQTSLNYLNKSLNILDGNKCYFCQTKKNPKKISCNIFRDKIRLGIIYCKLGDYEKSKNLFKDAQFILDNNLDNCPHHLILIYLNLGLGEIMLRTDKNEEAHSLFVQVLQDAKKLLHVNHRYAILAQIFSIEALIRLGLFDKAYSLCESIFQIKPNSQTNYLDLMLLTTYYHAAIIKRKQGDLKKSLEHFDFFLKKIKPLCKSILSEEKYTVLEKQRIFDNYSYKNSSNSDNIKQCIKKSILIFTAIYGEQHSFVRNYLVANS